MKCVFNMVIQSIIEKYSLSSSIVVQHCNSVSKLKISRCKSNVHMYTCKIIIGSVGQGLEKSETLKLKIDARQVSR